MNGQRYAGLLELDAGVLEVDDQSAHLVAVQLPAGERVHHSPVLQGEPVRVAQRHLEREDPDGHSLERELAGGV